MDFKLYLRRKFCLLTIRLFLKPLTSHASMKIKEIASIHTKFILAFKLTETNKV